MQLISYSPAVIYAGCFAATLSTALTNLLSVPRLVQALGVDRIYPGLIYFSKGYGKHGEPYRGYVLTFFISVAFVLIGEASSTCVTAQQCFPTYFPAYFDWFFKFSLHCCSRLERDRAAHLQLLPGVVRAHQLLHVPRGAHQATGVATHVQGEHRAAPRGTAHRGLGAAALHPGGTPRGTLTAVRPLGMFQYYNVWLSLVGFLLCIAIMFLIDWIASVITMVVIFALYLIVVYRKPGSSPEELL